MPPKKGARYRTDQKKLISEGKKYCPKCDKIKSLDQFQVSKSRANGYDSVCRSCKSVKGDREALDKINRARFIRRYGITPEQRDQMLEDQNGVCAICGEPPVTICVDHCHRTGLIRGILCTQCNTLIGMAHDKVVILESAIKYLEGNP